MSKLFGFAYALFFIASAFGFFAVMYLIEPLLLYFYVAMFLLMVTRYLFGWRFWLTTWARDVMTSIDQHWQVLMAPLFNLGVTTEHKFGNPDETASSVVGKNLQATGLLRWRVIEWFVSVLLEGGRPHSIPSIEKDV